MGERCSAEDMELYLPAIENCTDNGAMIAFAGCQRLLAGEAATLPIEARARWPLAGLTRPGTEVPA